MVWFGRFTGRAGTQGLGWRWRPSAAKRGCRLRRQWVRKGIFMMDFEKMDVWHLTRTTLKKIYFATRKFPDYEKFGMVNQINRAGMSILANIAEGCGRETDKDFKHFLVIAKEVVMKFVHFLSWPLIAEFCSKEDFDDINKDLNRIGDMLFGFIKNLELRIANTKRTLRPKVASFGRSRRHRPPSP